MSPNVARPAINGSLSSDDGKISSVWSPYRNPTLSVVSEDKPWDNFSAMEGTSHKDDESSFSGLSSSGVYSPFSSEDVSGDTEVQSRYKGPLDSLLSLEDALPCK